MEENCKNFHLGDVLSVTTGRLLSPKGIGGVYEILNFMTNDNLYTHQLPRAAEECKPFLFSQFPQLDSPEMDFAVTELELMLETESGKQEPMNLILGWLSKLTSGKYGVQITEELSVLRIYEWCHEKKNPIEELVQMRNK